MHKKQKIILHKLATINGQKFSELQRGFSYDDKFAYHIKQLLRNKFVIKRTGKYYLSRKGAIQTSYFDKKTFRDTRHKIPILVFVCRYKNKFFIYEKFWRDGNRKTLYCLPGTKALWGKNLVKQAADILDDKYHIKGDLEFRATYHYLEYTTDKKLMFDDICLIYDVTNVIDPKKAIQGVWMTREEIDSLSYKWILIQDLIVEDKKDRFIEGSAYGNYFIHEEDL